jgi:eukaryotic-like serine/threonine-protein kinase
VLFEESGEGGGTAYSIYVRRTDGSPAVRVGEGTALGLSADGRSVLAVSVAPPALVLIPVGAGEARTLLPPGTLRVHSFGAGFLPDGKRIWFSGSEGDRPNRSYVLSLDGGAPVPVTPEGTQAYAATPDGRYLSAIVGLRGGARLYPIEGGEPRDIPFLEPDDLPLRWTADGRSLFVWQNDVPAPVYRIDAATGRRELAWRLVPSDPAGISRIMRVVVAADGRSCFYSYKRQLSDLFVAEGLR